MKSVKKLFLLMLVATLTLSSCSQRLIDFTVISSKNHSLKFKKSEGVVVKGSSMGVFGFGVTIKDAMDKALASAGPDYDLLIDGVVRAKNYPFYSGFQVEGTAVSSSKLKALLGNEGFDEWCKENNLFNPSSESIENN